MNLAARVLPKVTTQNFIIVPDSTHTGCSVLLMATSYLKYTTIQSIWKILCDPELLFLTYI